jgi:DNA-binding transcriptional ArsR family regulator
VTDVQPLPATFSALADPTRLAILARLAEGEATVNELAAPFPISQPAISRHIRVLEDAGLILRRIDGTRRPCRLAPEALDGVEDWLAGLRRAFEANYSRLDRVLAAMRAEEGRAGNDPSKP